MSGSWFGSSAGLCCYVGIPAVRAAIDEMCYVGSVTNQNVVQAASCAQDHTMKV